MQNYIPQKLEIWQFQPVHNVFLLILSELGLVGLGLFVWFLFKVFHACPPEKCSTPARRVIVPRGTITGGWNIFGRVEHFKCHSGLVPESRKILNQVQDDKKIIFFKSILLAFIFIMLFDHYLWDIQQGQILLWLTFGLIVGDNKELFDKA
jgi:O-antigen ligase